MERTIERLMVEMATNEDKRGDLQWAIAKKRAEQILAMDKETLAEELLDGIFGTTDLPNEEIAELAVELGLGEDEQPTIEISEDAKVAKHGEDDFEWYEDGGSTRGSLADLQEEADSELDKAKLEVAIRLLNGEEDEVLDEIVESQAEGMAEWSLRDHSELLRSGMVGLEKLDKQGIFEEWEATFGWEF